MKKTLLTLLSVLFCAITFAQSAPQGINYHGIARDVAGTELANDTLTIRFYVLEGNTISWEETDTVITDAYGVFTKVIVTSAAFNAIDWGDSTLIFSSIVGCTDTLYLEYDANVTCNDTNACATLIVNGCTDTTAFNYDANANTDDGSCIAVVNGCTDSTATNYDALANTDDGSCTYTPQYPAGSVFCASGPTAIVDVTNPVTGKTWMDRNLGATQAATSSTDAASYGDLYQWGRREDGHQCRTSATTATLSSIDQPANGNFILVLSAPYDWRVPQNTNLWQGVNGINNPCPSGYRLPTEAELDAERLSWSSNSAAGAFASPLKWPMAGYRVNSSVSNAGSYGLYWSSSVNSTNSRYLFFDSSAATMFSFSRASANCVRCIKD